MNHSQNNQVPPQHLQHQHAAQPHTQQQPDGSAQDVLAEARKNLQVLIDSGISRDLLHQWVDDSPPLQLNFPIQATLAASSQNLPQLASQHHIPPHPQGPPPPPPARSPSEMSNHGTIASSANSSTSPSGASAATTPTGSNMDIKSEPMTETTTAVPWTSVSTSSGHMPERPLTTVNESDNGVFIPPSFPYSHRARISVSSTSSGSSGHASLWSVNSARSSMSWHSTASSRCQAPLPMPPPMSTASGAPVINGSQVSTSSGSKQNVYWCTSCETSFKRKYDWKRHEDEFHERWRKYPCPEPGCNRSFWGSNSFNQHHKQCHGCKTCPHAEKVVKFLRKRKYWACGFCSALHPARERHVEHVARHFESGLSKNDWMHSRVVYGLLHQPLIHAAWDAMVNEKHSAYGGKRPQFSWHPSKTGRAQGFLEKESPGQLQDLLEFFSGDESEAQWIVSVAYDLADIVTTNADSQSPPLSQPLPSVESQQSYQHDSRSSFTPMAAPPSILPSSTPSNQSQAAFGAPTYRSSMFSTSQQFQVPSQASDSSNSPHTLSPAPVLQSQGGVDKGELPALPAQQGGGNEGMMDFEYSPAPSMFGDWGSLNPMLATTQVQTQQNNAPQSDWGMMQYFGDPRVTSA
ncbi:hypothetical protein K4F52_005656 [Lecanicillium sp. MT-2017a]|nr:hypothetical protein K4F52_005656 [Lecanicillium sp. MT-2017a]